MQQIPEKRAGMNQWACIIMSHLHGTYFEAEACRAETDRCVAICERLIKSASACDYAGAEMAETIRNLILAGGA